MECTAAQRGRENTVYIYIYIERKTHTEEFVRSCAGVYTSSNTHCDFMTEGGGPASENKAGIYSRLHSKQGEAQWTQAPDRDTDTLPRITGHGPGTLRAQSLCCFRSLGSFWAATLAPLPSVLWCAGWGNCLRAPPMQSSTNTRQQTCKKWAAANGIIAIRVEVHPLLCAAVARNHWWLSVSPCSNFCRLSQLSGLQFSLSAFIFFLALESKPYIRNVYALHKIRAYFKSINNLWIKLWGRRKETSKKMVSNCLLDTFGGFSLFCLTAQWFLFFPLHCREPNQRTLNCFVLFCFLSSCCCRNSPRGL